MWVLRKENYKVPLIFGPAHETSLNTNSSLKPPELIERLLISRGIENQFWSDLFEPKLSGLKDPFALKGMDRAVERLLSAFEEDEKICFYADFDLDGTSGLALTKTAFEKFGFSNLSFYQPRRLKEGYGFHAEAVRELAALDVKVIITIDVGITSHAACTVAQELGVDVILTDHHLPSETLPLAYTIVNPNQGDCPSKLGYLSGAGVAFYLIRALRRKMVERNFSNKITEKIKAWDIKEILDVFTIATLTDMVPLIEDNRVLVKHGLMALKHTKRPGLRELIKKLNFDGKDLTSSDVGIRIAPKLNALSRMDSEILPIHIYVEQSAADAVRLVEKMFDSNQDRLDLQSYAEGKAEELLKEWNQDQFIFIFSDQFHRGVIGLVATKLAQSYNKPTFIGSLNSEGIIVGSSRQPDDSNTSLVDALSFSGDALNRSGGHYSAAGFELNVKNADKFIQKLKQFYDLEKKNSVHKTEYDLEAHFSDVNENYLRWHYSLGPFGVGFPEPIYRFNQLRLVALRELKGGHLKLNFVEDSGGQVIAVDALCFSPKEKVKAMIKENHFYDVLGEVQKNFFRGKVSVQILVKDIMEAES